MKTVFTILKGYILVPVISGLLLYFPFQSNAQDEGSENRNKLEMSFFKDDTINKVKAVVTSMNETKEELSPVKDVEVKFYAKKSFGLLPLGDAQTTDENGVATIDFPTDLPGDSLGIIKVIARVEDNEDLGELEAAGTVNWGIPKYVDPSFHKRALWGSAANAPLPLVVTVTSMVLLVWGVILYIILLLFKIPKS